MIIADTVRVGRGRTAYLATTDATSSDTRQKALTAGLVEALDPVVESDHGAIDTISDGAETFPASSRARIWYR